MYYIKKYADCWAVHDDVSGGSRKLTSDEVAKLNIEFPALQDEKVVTIYADKIRSISTSLESYPADEPSEKKLFHINDHLKKH